MCGTVQNEKFCMPLVCFRNDGNDNIVVDDDINFPFAEYIHFQYKLVPKLSIILLPIISVILECIYLPNVTMKNNRWCTRNMFLIFWLRLYNCRNASEIKHLPFETWSARRIWLTVRLVRLGRINFACSSAMGCYGIVGEWWVWLVVSGLLGAGNVTGKFEKKTRGSKHISISSV